MTYLRFVNLKVQEAKDFLYLNFGILSLFSLLCPITSLKVFKYFIGLIWKFKKIHRKNKKNFFDSVSFWGSCVICSNIFYEKKASLFARHCFEWIQIFKNFESKNLLHFYNFCSIWHLCNKNVEILLQAPCFSKKDKHWILK